MPKDEHQDEISTSRQKYSNTSNKESISTKPSESIYKDSSDKQVLSLSSSDI